MMHSFPEQFSSDQEQSAYQQSYQLGTAYGMLAATAIAHSEAVQQNIELQEAIATDSLTGLPNRYGFMQAAEMLFDQTPGRENIVAMVVDATNFKAVNDRLGHPRGDATLCVIADFLQEQLRPSDIVGHAVAGRVGGDEFYALMDVTPREDTTLTPAERGEAVANRLSSNFSEKLATPELADIQAQGLHLAIGISTYEDGMKLTDIISLADADMYKRKRGQHHMNGPYRQS